ncbi:MAG: hypothetical protein ACE5FY_06730 [Nitrospiria bacterium]
MNEEFEAQEEFEALEQEFGEELMGLDADQEDFGELGEEIAEAGLEEFALEEGGETTTIQSLVSDGDQGQVEAAFLGRFLAGKVRRLIRRLIGLARRYRRIARCRRCIGLLIMTIRLFRRRRFVAALRYAYRTYRCFKHCLRRR